MCLMKLTQTFLQKHLYSLMQKEEVYSGFRSGILASHNNERYIQFNKTSCRGKVKKKQEILHSSYHVVD